MQYALAAVMADVVRRVCYDIQARSHGPCTGKLCRPMAAELLEPETMSELRQDPITHDWVIINPDRAARPHDTDTDTTDTHCPFCPGNEALSGDAVDRINDADGRWLVRTVNNKFPALRPDPDSHPHRHRPGSIWRRQAGYGHHEVIIETPDHQATIGTMPVAQARRVIEMYARRFRALTHRNGMLRQIVVFRNHGRRAGTSLRHPHSQIIATPVVSPEIRQRMASDIAFFDRTGRCGQCRVLAQELRADQRVIHCSARFVAIAPYASQVPYQIQIVPRYHRATFGDADAAERDDLADHLSQVLGALHRRLHDPDYNLVIFTPPLDQIHRSANHWFIEILPRLTTPAGFELGSRIVVNLTPPETVAQELRSHLSEKTLP